MKTSASHPIRVDFVAPVALGTPGRLGMTFAPGKKHQGITGLWHRDLDQDLTRLGRDYQADRLVCLVEAHELEQLQIADLPAKAGALGLALTWFPIRDQAVPESAPAFASLIADLVADLRRGRTVVIHCKGGLGRTGLVAAACLIQLGHPAAAAIATVRQARRGAVENAAQERFLMAFAANGPSAP